MIKYRVNYDNGASDAGTLPWTFDTYEEADAYGNDWALECNVRDFGCEDPEDEDGYSYEVIEVEEEFSDEEKDAHDGNEHQRMRQKEKT